MRTDFPEFHDGWFDGIRVGEDTATLYLRERNGKDRTLILEGVKALQMDDFRQGNIVVELETTKGARPSSNTPWERLFPSPHPSADQQYHDKYAQFLEAEIAKIVSGEHSLVMLSPAYGADLLAVCREASFRAT